MSTSAESGVTNLASPYSVDETMQRLVRVLEQAGMTIFARIAVRPQDRAGRVGELPVEGRSRA